MSPSRRSSSPAVWTSPHHPQVASATAGSDRRHSARRRRTETLRRTPTRFGNPSGVTTTSGTAASSQRCRHCCRTLCKTSLARRRCYDGRTVERRLSVEPSRRQNSLRQTPIDWYETKPARHGTRNKCITCQSSTTVLLKAAVSHQPPILLCSWHNSFSKFASLTLSLTICILKALGHIPSHGLKNPNVRLVFKLFP